MVMGLVTVMVKEEEDEQDQQKNNYHATFRETRKLHILLTQRGFLLALN